MIRLPRLRGGWLAGGLVLSLLIFGSILAAAPALAAPTFPDRGTRPVVDDAHILSAATVQSLSQKLTQLNDSTGRQFVVVTVPSLQGYEIEDYGYQLGRKWGLGGKDTDNGILFIIAPNERKTRIEVGYGLEPIITDALSSTIIQTVVIPRFKAGDMEGGVVAGTDALIQQLSLPEDEARAKAAAAAAPAKRHARGDFPPIAGIVIAIFIFFLISSIFRGGGGRRRRGGFGEALPWIILGSLANSRHDNDHWGGGGWGGGGGGGFSGGGGSFGGGGSSGSW